MTSLSNLSSYKNLSLCIYIGNTTAIDDKILFNYCSRFGTIISSFFVNKQFCDFQLIEFANYNQLESFLNTASHEINRIILDVKLYKHILTHNDILNIDRKFYIGPILNSKDENTVVQFYKTIDPTLQYCLSKQDKEVYLLFQFNNRQSITTIFEKHTVPITNEHRKCFLHKPVHPRQFVNKIISMKNKENQIYIHGLTNHITDTMLIDYFHKRAPVIACHILANDSTSAVIEFNDNKTVRKILDTPNVRLQGANLSLSKASHHLASLLSSTDNEGESDDDDDDNEVKALLLEPTLGPIRTQNQPPLLVLPSIHQGTIQQQSLSLVKSTSSPIITDFLLIPSPDNNESGWTSPPRTIITHSPSINQPSIRLSSNPHPTPPNLSIDPTCRPTTIDADIKPLRKTPSTNILRFVEQFENEIEQIKNEYRLKFDKDQTYIEQEINLLINEERQTFDKLSRYLIDHRNHIEKRNNSNKRKYNPSSSAE